MATGRPQATAALVACMALTVAERANGNDTIAPTEQPGPTIVLHVANYAALRPNVLDVAKARVEGVYKVIGVRVVWDNGGEAVSRLENGVLHVSVLLLPRDMRQKKNPADGTHADLLGQAHVRSGRAYIFYDRIAALPGPLTSIALGDVIAHEVGHIVLRKTNHSPSGIMRASLSGQTWYLQSFNGVETRAIRASLMAAK